MNRRHFLAAGTAAFSLAACSQGVPLPPPQGRKRLAVTMDDFNIARTPGPDSDGRNAAILAAFDAHRVKAAGFVTGMFIERAGRMDLVQHWADAGHLIGNHTYTHPHASQISVEAFQADTLQNHAYLQAVSTYQAILRFPFLDEGGEVETRDAHRRWMAETGFRNAPVTIDTQDWSITARLLERQAAVPDVDPAPFGAFYTAHVVELANHYHRLASALGYDDLIHTLLVHHTVLNGLFLGDVMNALAADGWTFEDAAVALDQPVMALQPDTPNGGRSVLDVIAYERSQATGFSPSPSPERQKRFARSAMDDAGL